MNPLAEMLKAGLHTTIQDMGRPGARHLGVPLSGAADPLSFALANAAIGNVPHAAGLECVMSGPTLRFFHDTSIAVGGADMQPRLNNVRVPLYTAINITAGDELILGAAQIGARSYIAFSGGLMGSAFLNSVSTYAPAELGGIEGRPLRSGDKLSSMKLPIGSPRDIPAEMRPRVSYEFVLRATTGPETESIGERQATKFFSSRFSASRRGDRMGVMLDGAPLEPAPSPPMASSPVFPGTVQLPPGGAPFLLLSDAQTVGGYPRIAQVIAADLPLAGQIRPGDHIWFRKTTPDAARDIALKKSALYSDYFPGGFFR